MNEQDYEIFGGSLDDPLWLETVKGLENAVLHMHERARTTPGRYFVYCLHTQARLAEINTLVASDQKQHATA